jgi:hypothetical protein
VLKHESDCAPTHCTIGDTGSLVGDILLSFRLLPANAQKVPLHVYPTTSPNQYQLLAAFGQSSIVLCSLFYFGRWKSFHERGYALSRPFSLYRTMQGKAHIVTVNPGTQGRFDL